MATKHCPGCGFELPETARFCMECGAAVGGAPSASSGLSQGLETVPGLHLNRKGVDLAAIGTAVVAYLGLRHLSRGARNTLVLLAFLFLFFGCPLICGFVMFAMEWLARLLGV